MSWQHRMILEINTFDLFSKQNDMVKLMYFLLQICIKMYLHFFRGIELGTKMQQNYVITSSFIVSSVFDASFFLIPT